MFEIRKLELRTVLTPINFHSPAIHLSYFQLFSVPPSWSLFFFRHPSPVFHHAGGRIIACAVERGENSTGAKTSEPTGGPAQ